MSRAFVSKNVLRDLANGSAADLTATNRANQANWANQANQANHAMERKLTAG